MTYIYFVSYVKGDPFGFGNMEVKLSELSELIVSIDDIRAIEEHISEKKGTECIILNYQLMQELPGGRDVP